jgi:hypothetical protein
VASILSGARLNRADLPHRSYDSAANTAAFDFALQQARPYFGALTELDLNLGDGDGPSALKLASLLVVFGRDRGRDRAWLPKLRQLRLSGGAPPGFVGPLLDALLGVTPRLQTLHLWSMRLCPGDVVTLAALLLQHRHALASVSLSANHLGAYPTSGAEPPHPADVFAAVATDAAAAENRGRHHSDFWLTAVPAVALPNTTVRIIQGEGAHDDGNTDSASSAAGDTDNAGGSIGSADNDNANANNNANDGSAERDNDIANDNVDDYSGGAGPEPEEDDGPLSSLPMPAPPAAWTAAFTDMLVALLRSMPRLEYLMMDNNALGNHGATALAAALAQG